MKLSICIPVYNFDVNELVADLQSQINPQISAEIILIDDASAQEFINKNKNLKSKVAQFIFLDNNIGRSRIRNLFLTHSRSEYLLFLDCDGKIINQDFLQTYYNYIQNYQPDVIFGGRKICDARPPLEYGLRWRFATERENLPVSERRSAPYLDFQTNNFVVRRSILENIPFNETITQYGYEDLVFSKDLQDHQIKIDHIDNPILNNDLETNVAFLDKADQSARSLAQLIRNDKEFEKITEIKLAKAYLKMKQTGLVPVYKLLYRFFKSYITRYLIKGNAPLRMLDLYKLGQLIGYMNKN